MDSRRKFALLISAACCAAALIYSTPTPGYRLGGPQSVTGFEISADADETMISLHQQASDALANLQAAHPARP